VLNSATRFTPIYTRPVCSITTALPSDPEEVQWPDGEKDATVVATARLMLSLCIEAGSWAGFRYRDVILKLRENYEWRMQQPKDAGARMLPLMFEEELLRESLSRLVERELLSSIDIQDGAVRRSIITPTQAFVATWIWV
jgi:hypothetical protein